MGTHRGVTALIIIAGPQASGKSTLAAALSRKLRDQGEDVALVELDQIAAMALPTLSSWEAAHRVFEVAVGQWLRADMTCVIAEGSGSLEEMTRVRAQAPSGIAVVTVATTVDLQTAIARAQSDPTRGVSKDESFLGRVYAAWPHELDRMSPDLLIDTAAAGPERGVEPVEGALAVARRRLVRGTERR